MKICYIILSCDKYMPTRGEWVRNSWLKHIRPTDSYVFLSSTPNPSRNVLGWNTPDDYNSAPFKYYAMFANTNLEADWYMFVDDDTFVFPRRLEAYLEQFDHSVELYTGKMSLDTQLPHYMSGGAGFALSRPLYTKIKTHVFNTKPPLRHIHTDVTMGDWMKDIGHTLFVYDTRFRSHPHKTNQELQSALTFHYVTEPLFATYLQYV